MAIRRLPSLNGLRAFEAAARHGSFVGAADELNVTQAAISRMLERKSKNKEDGCRNQHSREGIETELARHEKDDKGRQDDEVAMSRRKPTPASSFRVPRWWRRGPC